MLKEFKEFAMRGNVVDMAVGIIIGAAFGRIISSLVSDVIMPPIGLLLGKVDFSSLFVNISGKSYPTLAAAKAAGAATINYGVFLNTILDFIIVAFVIFLFIRQINRWSKPAPASSADYEGMSVLLFGDSDQGHAVPELHVRGESGVGCKKRDRENCVSPQRGRALILHPRDGRGVPWRGVASRVRESARRLLRPSQ